MGRAMTKKGSVFILAIAAIASAQTVNPGRVNVVTTPWSVNWLTHNADGPALTDLGFGVNAGNLNIAGLLDLPYANAMHYGATGDGATDDQPAIQTGINALQAAGGGTLVFPPGTYRLAAAVVVTGDDITIEGIGAQSILQIDDGVVANAIEANDVSRFTVRDLWIDGNRAGTVDQDDPQQQNGVRVINDSADEADLLFLRVRTTNCFSDAVRVMGADGYITDRVTFESCYVDTTDRGLHAQYCGTVRVLDCHTNDTEKGAIYIDQAHDNIIVQGNDVNDVGNLQNGVFVRGCGPTVGGGGAAVRDDCNDVVIAGNSVNDDGGGGFGINTSGYVQRQTISGNVVAGWSYDGISANQGFMGDPNQGPSYATIAGNVSGRNGQYGGSLRSGRYATIAGNIWHHNESGLWIGGRRTSHVLVTGDQAFGNTHYGFYANDANLCEIQDCKAWDNESGFYATDCNSLVIRESESHDNSVYGILLASNNVATYLTGNRLFNNTTANYLDSGSAGTIYSGWYDFAAVRALVVSTKSGTWVADDLVGGWGVYGSDTTTPGIGIKGGLKIVSNGTTGGATDTLLTNSSATGNDEERLRVTYQGTLQPGADNVGYLGRNDDDSPKAWKGVILKDTVTGKYYRLQITSGAVALVDLTD